MFKVNAENLDQYFRSDPEREADLRAVDILIRTAAPSLGRWFYAGTPAGTPGMRMKMIGYGKGTRTARSGASADWPIIGLALQKNYISLYFSISKQGVPIIDTYLGRLGEERSGRNNFSFIHFNDLDSAVLTALVQDVADTVQGEMRS